MDSRFLEVGEVYNHPDLGRVRLEELPREDPEGARVVILGGRESDETRTVSVERDALSLVDPNWNPETGSAPSQDVL